MDPDTRILKRVQVIDDDEAEINLTFSTLMGEEVEPRREFIEENAKYATLDIQ